MRLVVVLLFVLVVALGFAEGNKLTAKEAHDKMVECEKKCARMPNLLRCQQQCRQFAQVPPAHVKDAKKPVAAKKPTHVQPKMMLLKGRRVTLEMRKKH